MLFNQNRHGSINMIKRLTIGELQLGMYVCGFEKAGAIDRLETDTEEVPPFDGLTETAEEQPDLMGLFEPTDPLENDPAPEQEQDACLTEPDMMEPAPFFEEEDEPAQELQEPE